MAEGNLTPDPEEPSGPLILLHGRTFDRPMWHPAAAELLSLEPRRRVLAVDLPGHGWSPAWPSYDFEGIAEEVHRAARNPRRFAECLAATRRSTLPRQPGHIGPRTAYSEPAP